MQVLGVVGNPHYEAGLSYLDQGQLEMAIIELGKVASGAAGATRGQMKLARFHLGQAHQQLADRHIQRHQWTAAEEHLREALQINPHYPDLHYQLARVLCSTDRLPEALKAVRQALALNARYARAIALEALILYRQGDRQTALDRARESVELEPALDSNALRDAQDRNAAGDYEGAAASLAAMAETSVDELADLLRSAREKLKAGAIAEAESFAREAVRLSPDYPDVRNVMGQVHLAKGEHLHAVNEFKTALQKNPVFLAAVINLGRACRAMGNEDAAREAFRKALVIDPDNEEVRELLSQ
ncbi:MAG: tetratricopeptide repeat protein [Armatimonadota bacterium]